MREITGRKPTEAAAGSFPGAAATDLPVLLGEISDGVSVQDAQGRLVYVNAAAARASGFDSPEEMLAAPPQVILERFELLDEAGDPLPFDRLPGREALAGRPGRQITIRFRIRETGEERWSIVRALPLLDRDGSLAGVINLFNDITDQRRAVEALRESETRFRTMADHAPVLIWMAGTDARYNFFNRPWLEFTGRKLEQELGNGWAEGVHPDDSDGCLRTYRSAFQARQGFRMNYRLRRADGEYRWMLDTGVPRFTPGGEFTGYIGSCVDITDLKRAADGMQFLLDASAILGESLDYRTRLRRLADLAVPRLCDWCAVDILQENGTIERLSVAHTDPAKVAWAYELQRRYPPSPDAQFGVPNVVRTGESEFYPEVPHELLVAAARDAEHLKILEEIGFSSAMVVPLRGRSGTLGAITLVSAESGRRYDHADLALAEDLARRAATALINAGLFEEVEQAREALEEQTAELEEVAAELEATNEELTERTAEAEAANRAKANFLAMMSHELRTPLNAIAGYVDLLDMGIHGPISDEQRQDLRRIRASQGHLLGIINDVLNFARLESGHLELSVEDLPLDSALDVLEDLLEPQLQAKQLAYERHRDGAAPVVRADPEKLRQILLNLLGNAIKFTPPGGRISVDWEADPSQVRVRVQDTGRGIPADRLQSIFEPFVQVDPALTRETSGVGLGLAISRDLAKALGGSLEASSEAGGGSTFVLTLPRAGEEPVRSFTDTTSADG